LLTAVPSGYIPHLLTNHYYIYTISKILLLTTSPDLEGNFLDSAGLRRATDIYGGFLGEFFGMCGIWGGMPRCPPPSGYATVT
jgi:hypothetical protein